MREDEDRPEGSVIPLLKGDYTGVLRLHDVAHIMCLYPNHAIPIVQCLINNAVMITH